MLNHNPMLLVVDDEPLNQEIIAEYLEDSPYKMRTADDGAQAWDILQTDPDVFDAVLLDRMMPNMDGIEVTRRMKDHPVLREIPIIMQTAAAAKDDVVSGLQAGVYYYLTKPFEEEVLRSIVDAAVEDYRRNRELSEQVRSRDEVLNLMRRCDLEVRTLEDARGAAAFLANACPQPQKVAMGLSELLLNGVEHGNLGLSYADKSRLHGNGAWEQEIEHRLALPQNAAKRVTVSLSRDDERITIDIRDTGTGFDWKPYLDLDPARAFDSHGRGIAMARLLSFDELEYRGCGNEVRVRIDL